MYKDQAKKIVEALLYMTDHALSLQEIEQILDSKQITEGVIKNIITELSSQYEGNGSSLRIVEVAGGLQMSTRPDMAPWIRRLFKERLTVRLSPSALETLSIIAYKQPITRSEIEQIRGVEATGVMETLLERRMIKVVGRKETIGRPLLYGTSAEFLRHFGLKHLSELPDLNSFVSQPPLMDEVQQELIPEESFAGVGSEGEPVPEKSSGMET
jgi:segregation and condensation protein B